MYIYTQGLIQTVLFCSQLSENKAMAIKEKE